MKTDNLINEDGDLFMDAGNPQMAAEAFGVMLAVHELMANGRIDEALMPVISDRSVELANLMISGKMVTFDPETKRYVEWQRKSDGSTLTVEV